MVRLLAVDPNKNMHISKYMYLTLAVVFDEKEGVIKLSIGDYSLAISNPSHWKVKKLYRLSPVRSLYSAESNLRRMLAGIEGCTDPGVYSLGV